MPSHAQATTHRTSAARRLSSSGPKPQETAFSAHFLDRARRREASAHPREALAETDLSSQARWAGPWEVERVPAGDGILYAVTRRAEPAADGGGARWVSPHRQDALLAAATFTALATPNQLTLNPAARGGSRRRLGYPVHDGTRHLGHLTRPDEPFLAYHHMLRSLAASPDAAALFVDALDPETLASLGRAIMRRLE